MYAYIPFSSCNCNSGFFRFSIIYTEFHMCTLLRSVHTIDSWPFPPPPYIFMYHGMLYEKGFCVWGMNGTRTEKRISFCNCDVVYNYVINPSYYSNSNSKEIVWMVKKLALFSCYISKIICNMSTSHWTLHTQWPDFCFHLYFFEQRELCHLYTLISMYCLAFHITSGAFGKVACPLYHINTWILWQVWNKPSYPVVNNTLL